MDSPFVFPEFELLTEPEEEDDNDEGDEGDSEMAVTQTSEDSPSLAESKHFHTLVSRSGVQMCHRCSNCSDLCFTIPTQGICIF